MVSCKSLEDLFVQVDAATAFQNKEYTVAADLLQDEYEQQGNELEKSKIAFRIAECYRLSNKTVPAEQWYKNALQFYSEPEAYYKYGLMQKANGKYREAVKTFTEYARSNPIDRANAKRQMRSCQMAEEWMDEPLDYKIFPLVGINSPASDYAPVLFGDDKLIFTSSRSDAAGEGIYGWTGEKHSDFFQATKSGMGEFSNAISFSDSLNTNVNEGTITFSSDLKEAYFTRCGNDVDDGDDYCGIFYSQFSDGNWSLPEQVILFESDSINVGQPFLSPDGKNLFFSADAPGGIGDKDIYVSEMELLGWGAPKNLGPRVNTIDYEGFPYMHSDGKLYFASNGHLGMGGLDVFSASFTKGRWDKVENLQYPINSPADDLGIIFQPSIPPALIDSVEAIGYITSSRKGGAGNDDIFQFVLTYPQEEEEPEPVEEEPRLVILLEGIVKGKEYADPNNSKSEVIGTSPIEEAVVEVLGLNLESVIAERLITDEKGQFSLELEQSSEYKVSGSKVDFFSDYKNVKTLRVDENMKDTLRVNVELVLNRIFKQQEITLDNIYYDLDSFAIRDDAKPVLNELSALLAENPSIQIELGSHTDSRGQDKYNQELSQNRAQAVVTYLARTGIDGRRMVAKGYGETALVNGCADGVECEEFEHQQNRRTTFKVLSDTFRAR